MSRTGRAAAGLTLTAAAWAALAGMRPEVTYHLAPAVLTWIYPYLRLGGEHPSYPEAVVAVLIGATTALALTGLLTAAGWLEGPALVGGNAAGEALLVVAAATVVGLGVGVTRAGSR